MQKVRFLVPFIIFLVLFFLTSGLCYHFFNEKQQISDKIKFAQTKIGAKLPITLSESQADTTETELSIKSEIFIKTVNTRKKLESIMNNIGFKSSEAEVPKQITGEGDSKTKTSAAKYAEKMKGKLDVVDYKKDLESIYKWLVDQQSLLKKFNNIKSQHFIDYSPTIGFDVQTQIAKANALIASLKNPDVTDAISAFTLFFNESQEIDKNSMTWKQIDAINTYVTNPDYKNDVMGYVSAIETAVNEYAAFVNKNGLKLIDLNKSREIMFEAYSNCVKLVKLLSIYTTTIDGEERSLILPKISESKAKDEASELLVLLHPNDNAFFKRIYEGGMIQPDVNMPTDEFGVANLEFAALIADSMSEINARRFRTNPAYNAGISLEKIINAQSLTIDTLVEMNKMLKNRLLLVYSTSSGDALPSIPVAIKVESVADISKFAGDQVLDLGARIDALKARTKNSNDKRDELLKVSSDIAEIADDLKEEFEKLKVPIDEVIAKHKARLESLDKQFINLKMKIADDIKSEGKLRPSQGEDGIITFTDRLNESYNINLGKADKIVPGMRFLVYNETGGTTNVKGLIEVLNLRQDHFANCGLIIKYPGADILKGDKISNPFFRKVDGKAEFLSVAFIGKFEPPESNVSNAQMKIYLSELGVKVMDKPDSSTDLIILAKPISKLAIRTAIEKQYVEDLRPKIRFDELEVKDILVYFQDQ